MSIPRGTGRYDGIPHKSNIEFRDGVYYDLGSDTNIQLQRAKEAILDILEDTKSLERQTLVKLAAEKSGASESTSGTALDQLRDNGVIVRSGKGRKGDPYRFELLDNDWLFGS